MESGVTVRKGAAKSTPFLMTRNWPFCWQTNKRLSGAKSIAVGLEIPLATTDSLNPDGSVAAEAAPAARTRRTQGISLSFDFMGFIFVAGLLRKMLQPSEVSPYPVLWCSGHVYIPW